MCFFVCLYVSMRAAVCVYECECVVLFVRGSVFVFVCFLAGVLEVIRSNPRRILNETDFEETNKQTDENPSPHIINSKSNLNIASGLNPTTVPIVPGGTSSSSTMGRLSGRDPSHMSR